MKDNTPAPGLLEERVELLRAEIQELHDLLEQDVQDAADGLRVDPKDMWLKGWQSRGASITLALYRILSRDKSRKRLELP
jgi:hypothetical protein